MLAQELQDLNEPVRPGSQAVKFLQCGAEVAEARGELPVTEDRRMIECAGLPAESREVVDRVENHLVFVETSRVCRDFSTLGDDYHAVDIALDGDRLKGKRSGGAVTVAVEGDGLVLVDHDRGTEDARVEPMLGQRRRRSEVLTEAILDREGAEERLHDSLPLGLATRAKERVQLLKVGNSRHRSGKSTLHGLDGRLGVGLFVTASRHAELRVEDVVSSQRLVARVNLAFPPFEDERGDGLGVVPPDLAGHGPEELEGGDHPFEDGLGALKGERQHEGSVGVGPNRNEEGYGPTSVGEVDVDVAEIRLEPLPGKMPKRDMGLAMGESLLGDVTPHLDISAEIAVFVAEATPHLRGGVPLLGRGGLVVAEDLVDDRLKGSQDRCGAVPGHGHGTGLGMLEDLPNGVG